MIMVTLHVIACLISGTDVSFRWFRQNSLIDHFIIWACTATRRYLGLTLPCSDAFKSAFISLSQPCNTDLSRVHLYLVESMCSFQCTLGLCPLCLCFPFRPRSACHLRSLVPPAELPARSIRSSRSRLGSQCILRSSIQTNAGIVQSHN